MIKSLSKSQIEQYYEEGYTVVEGALPADRLAETLRLTDEIIDAARGLSDDDERYDLEESHTPDDPRVRRLKSPFLHWPFFDDLLRDALVLDVIEPLMGPNMRLYNNKMNIKAPGYGAAVEWHQDWAFYPHTNDVGCAVGFYLDDVTATNGPMMMIPGSHKGPVFDHHAQGYFCGAMDPVKCPLDYENAVPVMGEAGTMTIHHVRTVHGSALNHSDKPRRLLLQGYFAADAWPLVGFKPGQDLDQFNELVVRGEASLVPRLEDVPARMPLPLAPNQGSIYENQLTLENRYFDTVDKADGVAAE
ncbi:MAG: phytanoyl-CoA dioxygenase family protein [Rhodospirillaceae bacterium]|jgi:phytanoyl-CoA hydroxylase|nr:phytanoyl-CoA dioxygenase family protein [Rhodospirillales bacterium]MBT3907997.1 phytanoyl-CoA dioxygenase family protein [Rhodospirillaceae bacterium]MBT4702270.1 phytanoyl-CoA dioxygenase family protein [Rhodospirillaceae bacterium]MBT5036644.1 phytanoyl-CoA dioxygenase family protein [Rhodospirillaceae bacterium]MBT6220874.1 phytanoyl-CoA dioxygenase family protein [Rhodospirillaceae bacterium]